jgi:hypothetical protein
MPRLQILGLIAAVLFLLLPAITAAQDILPPCRFYGHVRIDGYYVLDGTVITAIVDGDVYTTTTPAVYGESTYAIKITPHSGSQYEDGTLISFKIDGYDALQTAKWASGNNTFLNLTTYTYRPPEPTPTPATTTTVTPTPQPQPTVTPTPIPTIAPTPTPTMPPLITPPPTQPATKSLNIGKVIGLTFFSIVDVILIGLLIYLLWRFFIRPEQEPEP